MKIRYDGQSGVSVGGPPQIGEEFVAQVLDLRLEVLQAVTRDSRFALEPIDSTVGVLLGGTRWVGRLEPTGAAWASSRRVTSATTHSWSAEPGQESLLIVLRATV